MERVDEFPTIPYDPSQLTPGIEASLQNQSDSYRTAPMGEGHIVSNIRPTNLQEYMDMLHDDYYTNVTAFSHPTELENIENDLENTRNTVMRQISNQVGGYGPNRKFQLFPKGIPSKTPTGYENASHTMLDMLRQMDIKEKGFSDITQEMIMNAKIFGTGDPSNAPKPLDLDEDGNLAYVKELEKLKRTRDINNALKNTLPGNYDENFAHLMESFKGKRRENLMSSRNFFNNLVRRYGPQGATEILRNHPALKLNRQRSLAEVLPAYQTENPFNPDGSIKPGAVPPVTAVKQMSASDIKRLMLGAGLMPIGSQTDSDNEGYERTQVIPRLMRQFDKNRSQQSKDLSALEKPMIIAEHDSQNRGGTQAGSFVSPTTIPDIRRAIVASKREPQNLRMLGVRGLNPVDDFVQQRASTGQQEATSEGYIHSRIDPSRLVPIEMPKGDIPATVRGDVSIDVSDPTPSQEQRVAAILGTVDEGFKPGITRNTITPKLTRRGGGKRFNLQSLFRFNKDGYTDGRNAIRGHIARNEDRMKDLDESLEIYYKRLKDLNNMTSQITNPHTLVNHEDSIEHAEFRIDDLEGEKEKVNTQIQHLNHRLKYYNQDFQEAVKQYADGLKSIDEKLPFLTDMPLEGIDLTDTAKYFTSRDGYDGGTELDDRKKLNLNLDKHGFPLKEDGTAMTLDEKINLVTDPNLEELAENIFKNRNRVLDQIMRYNTKLPFGDDTPTKKKIGVQELEDYIKRLESAKYDELDARGYNPDNKAFEEYLNNLRRDYYEARVGVV